MKKTELEALYKAYPIGINLMYDFSLGKSDFRKVTISRIEEVNTIACFRFNNVTGFWPVEKKLIKTMDEIGIGSSVKELVTNRFDKSYKYEYENIPNFCTQNRLFVPN